MQIASVELLCEIFEQANTSEHSTSLPFPWCRRIIVLPLAFCPGRQLSLHAWEQRGRNFGLEDDADVCSEAGLEWRRTHFSSKVGD